MVKHLISENFKEEILDKKGISIIDFYANWCGPCMRIAPIMEEISNSRAGYSVFKVDVDNNQDISRRLKIDTLPTICILKDGILVDKLVGYRDKEQIIDSIEKHM